MSISNSNLFQNFDYELSHLQLFVKNEHEKAFLVEFQDFFTGNHFVLLTLLFFSKSLMMMSLAFEPKELSFAFKAFFFFTLLCNIIAFLVLNRGTLFLCLTVIASTFESFYLQNNLSQEEFPFADIFLWIIIVCHLRIRLLDFSYVIAIKSGIGSLTLFLLDEKLFYQINFSNYLSFLGIWGLSLGLVVYFLAENQRKSWIYIDSYRKTKTQFETFFDKFSFLSGNTDSKLNFITLNAKAKSIFEGCGFSDLMTPQAFSTLTNDLSNFDWEKGKPYNANHVLNLKDAGLKICDIYFQKVLKKELSSFQYVFVVIRHEKFHSFLSFISSLKRKTLKRFKGVLERSNQLQNESEQNERFINPVLSELNTIANFHLTQNQIFDSYSSVANIGDVEQDDAFYVGNYAKKVLDSLAQHAFLRNRQIDLRVEVGTDQVGMGKLWLADRFLTNVIPLLYEKDLVKNLNAKIFLEEKKLKFKLEFQKNGKLINLDQLLNGGFDGMSDLKLLPYEINILHLGKTMREAFYGFQVTELDKKISINLKFQPIKVSNPELPFFYRANTNLMQPTSDPYVFLWRNDLQFLIKKLSSEELIQVIEKSSNEKKRKKSNIFVYRLREKLKNSDLTSLDKMTSSLHEEKEKALQPFDASRKFTPTFIRFSTQKFFPICSFAHNIGNANLNLSISRTKKKIILNPATVSFSLSAEAKEKKGKEFLEEALNSWQDFIINLMEHVMGAVYSQIGGDSEAFANIPSYILNLCVLSSRKNSISFPSETSIIEAKIQEKNRNQLTMSPISLVNTDRDSPLPSKKNSDLEIVEEKKEDVLNSNELLKIDEVSRKCELSANDSVSSSKNYLSSSDDSTHRNSQNGFARKNKSKFSTLETYITPNFENVPTFLFVDDNPSVRLSMQKAKLEFECKFITAKNAEIGFSEFEAFAKESKQFHGLFIDCVMPEKDGNWFVQKVRESEKSFHLYRSWIWGMKMDDEEEMIEGLEGVDEILKKPFSRDSLNTLIKKRLEDIGIIGIANN